ncbi:MAG: glycosyltransferase [Lysobacterales bacterium]|nr:MAG: glycosyltransferase [Xanthomonadales bacterium]
MEITRISVVIPTFERPGPLSACLTALAVGFPPDAETIVVADGGTQDLSAVVAPFVEPLRLRLFKTANCGPAAARNRGIEHARGETIAFTDDDCRPQPGWLITLTSGVVTNPPLAVGGSTLNGLPGNAYADAAQLVLNLLSRHDRDLVHRERLLPSNNLAFPRGALRQLGGFNERFRTAEDRELCRRWAAAGYALGRVPAAVAEHDSELDFTGFVRKFFAYGRGASKFHQSDANMGLRESMHFHLRLPALVVPELRQRGLVRGVAIIALLILWETANLAGFIADKIRPAAASGKAAANHPEAMP